MTAPTAAERAKALLGDKVHYLPDGLYHLQPSVEDITAALEAHAAEAVRVERERIATKMETGAKHADDLQSLALMSWAASVRKGE